MWVLYTISELFLLTSVLRNPTYTLYTSGINMNKSKTNMVCVRIELTTLALSAPHSTNWANRPHCGKSGLGIHLHICNSRVPFPIYYCINHGIPYDYTYVSMCVSSINELKDVSDFCNCWCTYLFSNKMWCWLQPLLSTKMSCVFVDC